MSTPTIYVGLGVVLLMLFLLVLVLLLTRERADSRRAPEAAAVNAAILDALRARAHAIGHGRERCDRTGAPDGTGGRLGRANRARHGCARGGLGQAPAIGLPRLSPEVSRLTENPLDYPKKLFGLKRLLDKSRAALFHKRADLFGARLCHGEHHA